MLKIPWRCSCQQGPDFGRLAEQRARREMIDRTFMEGNQFPADGQDTMALLFQHMVSVGMVNANALQSISIPLQPCISHRATTSISVGPSWQLRSQAAVHPMQQLSAIQFAGSGNYAPRQLMDKRKILQGVN